MKEINRQSNLQSFHLVGFCILKDKYIYLALLYNEPQAPKHHTDIR